MMHNLPCETCRGLEKVHVTDQPVTIPFANPNPMGRRPPRAQERRPCFPRLPRLKKRRLVLCRAGGCTPSRDRTSKRDLEASACATCTSRHDFPREMDHGHRVALAQLARSFSGRVYSIANPSIDQTSLEFLPVTLRYALQMSVPDMLRCSGRNGSVPTGTEPSDPQRSWHTYGGVRTPPGSCVGRIGSLSGFELTRTRWASPWPGSLVRVAE